MYIYICTYTYIDIYMNIYKDICKYIHIYTYVSLLPGCLCPVESTAPP